MTHDSLGGDDAKLFVALLLPLEDDGQQLLGALDQLEVLLLGKLETRDLIVEHANVLVAVTFELARVLQHVDLMAQRDCPEEFSQHDARGRLLRTVHDGVCLAVAELLSELDFVWQVLKR